jgi:hypothetical protein
MRHWITSFQHVDDPRSMHDRYRAAQAKIVCPARIPHACIGSGSRRRGRLPGRGAGPGAPVAAPIANGSAAGLQAAWVPV